MQQDSTLVSLIIGRYGAAIWGIVALVLGKWGITFTDAETSQIMAGVSAVLSVFLICLSKYREWKKARISKEPPSILGNSGTVQSAILWALAAVLIAFWCVFAFNGCATIAVESDAKIAAARIIARHAGAHVAANNPELATMVIVSYDAIEKATGEPYLISVESILSQMLMDKGVQDSDLLLADARDILGLFGVPIPTAAAGIDLAWLQQFDIDGVRSVAEAFVGAMR